MMAKIVAYACSTRPNALWSAAQFDNAAPKNRTECDIPLVAKADYDKLDWLKIAESAGKHGIRFPTNASMEAFLRSVLDA
jgi:hypothetical protein